MLAMTDDEVATVYRTGEGLLVLTKPRGMKRPHEISSTVGRAATAIGRVHDQIAEVGKTASRNPTARRR
jgi:hypothetical protein